jgi:hypothetical protein
MRRVNNSSLPNWICAVCLVVIMLWVIEKRLQEERLSREFDKAAQKIDRQFEGTKEYWDRLEREATREGLSVPPDVKLPPLPRVQPQRQSSEWAK